MKKLKISTKMVWFDVITNIIAGIVLYADFGISISAKSDASILLSFASFFLIFTLFTACLNLNSEKKHNDNRNMTILFVAVVNILSIIILCCNLSVSILNYAVPALYTLALLLFILKPAISELRKEN